MSDPSQPVSPTSLPSFSDVYFRRLFIPLIIVIIVLMFVFVLLAVPSDVDTSYKFIGGGLISSLKKLYLHK
jgi:hypothetical protein